MGSPSSRLKTPEHLRPWVESGLEYILNPGGQGVVQTVEQQPVQSMKQPVQPQVQQPVQQQAPQQQSVTPQPQQSPRQPVAQPPVNSGFPEPWSGFLKHAKPQAKVVWTYMELGLDLGGQSDPRRSNVLKNLLAHLKWPPGTATFWPVSAITNNALQPDSNMFWQGWQLWKTPYIACFGEESLRVLLPNAEPGKTVHLLESVTIYVLPPMAELVNMLPHEQQLATEALLNVRI